VFTPILCNFGNACDFSIDQKLNCRNLLALSLLTFNVIFLAYFAWKIYSKFIYPKVIFIYLLFKKVLPVPVQVKKIIAVPDQPIRYRYSYRTVLDDMLKIGLYRTVSVYCQDRGHS
jgi:hypothetical protein